MNRHSSFIRLFVLLICIGAVLCLLPSPVMAATYPGADDLGTLTENDIKSQTLTDGKAHLYVTPGGGRIEIEDMGYGFHRAFANANQGWEFVRWGTYYESNGLIKNGKNPKLKLGIFNNSVDTYIFVIPDSYEAYSPDDPWLEIIDINDDMTLKEDFYLYAVFAPKVELQSDLSDEVGIAGSGLAEGQKIRMEFTASYGSSIDVYFALGGRDLVNVTINNVPIDESKYTFKNDRVYVNDISITEPSTIRVHTRGWPFTVAFDSNGGSGSMESQTFYTEDACRLNPNTFVKEGYTFTGWSLRRDGKGTMYEDADRIILWDAKQGDTVTLYAQWEHTDHEGGIATCKHQAQCSICKNPYGPLNPNNHENDATWTTTETQHMRSYKCCNKTTIGLSDHEWEEGICIFCGYIDENGTGGGGILIGGGMGGSIDNENNDNEMDTDSDTDTDHNVPQTGDGSMAMPLALMALAVMLMLFIKKTPRQ